MKIMTNDQIAQMVNIIIDADYYVGRFKNHYSDEFKGRCCLCKTCYPSFGFDRRISEVKKIADSFELNSRGKVLFFREISFNVFVFFEKKTKAGIGINVFANGQHIAYKEWFFDGFDEESNRLEFERLFKFICKEKSFKIYE